MANLISDRRDIDFVLYEQLDVLALTKLPKYKGYNRKTFDLVSPSSIRAFRIPRITSYNVCYTKLLRESDFRFFYEDDKLALDSKLEREFSGRSINEVLSYLSEIGAFSYKSYNFV